MGFDFAKSNQSVSIIYDNHLSKSANNVKIRVCIVEILELLQEKMEGYRVRTLIQGKTSS